MKCKWSSETGWNMKKCLIQKAFEPNIAQTMNMQDRA